MKKQKKEDKVEIEKINTKRSKKQWIKFMEWWKRERQDFDPMPIKLRKFKKRYNMKHENGRKLLIRHRQRRR